MPTVLQVLATTMADDPVYGAALIDEVVATVLDERAAQLAPILQPTLGAWAAGQVAIAKRELGRGYVVDRATGRDIDPRYPATARWLSDLESYLGDSRLSCVAKAVNEQWDIGGHRTTRSVNRDFRGRFRAGVDRGLRVDPLQYGARDAGKLSPRVANYMVSTKGRLEYSEGQKIDGARQSQLEHHQSQWEQAGEHLSAFASTFTSDEKTKIDAVLTVESGSGKISEIVFPLSELKNGIPHSAAWKLEDSLISVEIDAKPGASTEIDSRVAHFNAVGATGGMSMARLANVPSEKWSGLAQSFTDAAPTDSRLTRLFRQISSGGKVLGALDPSSKMSHMAQFVGDVGPQAEKVLGPHVQRAGYRYRGTEKEPDADLAAALRSREMGVITRTAAAHPDALPELAQTLAANGSGSGTLAPAGNRDNRMDPVAGAFRYQVARQLRSGQPISGDATVLGTRADVAAHHLLSTLPDNPFTAAVSRASGRTLPSQGVIIDADGDLTSQSVGTGDDHYLPFDLAGLNGLRGGQYVRTRQQGGLTAEDVYTAVRAGARMVTVVSSSGVYSLEFDPSFRGGRANSDKAHGMYEAYVRILDAVDGSGLYTKPLPPAQRASIRARAERIGEKPEEVDRLEAEYTATAVRESRTIDEDTMAALGEKAQASAAASMGYNQLSSQAKALRVNDIYEELVTAHHDDAATPLTLNAEGYDLAIQTLAGQYPYFIRSATYEPLTSKTGPGFLASRGQDVRAGVRQRTGATDAGYVKPRGITAGGNDRGGPNRSKPRGAYWEDRVATATLATTGAPPATPTGGDRPTPAGPGPVNPGTAAAVASDNAPDASSRLGARLAGDAPVFEATRDKLATTFANEVGRLTGTADLTGARGTTWETAGSNKAAYLAEADQQQWQEALAADPEGVAAVLTAPGKMEAALDKVFGANGGEDFFGEGGVKNGNTIFGATTMADAVAAMRLKGREIADLTYMAAPFTAPKTGEQAAFHTGPRAQGLPEIVNLDHAGALAAWTDTFDGKRAVAAAHSIGLEVGGRAGLVDVAEHVSEQVTTLAALNQAAALARTEERSRSGSITPANIDNILMRSKTSRGAAAAAMGVEPGDLDVLGLREEPTERALDLQRAWTLVTVARGVGYLDGEATLPKALRGLADPGQIPDQPFGKSATPARPQLRVLRPDHPLSQLVAARVAKGLAPL